MANIVAPDARQPLVMRHIDRVLGQFEQRLGRALMQMQSEALFGIAVDEQLDAHDYDTVRQVVRRLAAERALANATMLNLARRELEAAYARQLAGPKDDRRFKRWAKE